MKLLSRYFKTLIPCILIFLSRHASAEDIESRCYGSTSAGSLEAAVQLPQKGNNFVVFSQIAWSLGRTFVHSKVAQVIKESYEQLAQDLPSKQFMYAETGLAQGGKFPPHKTHQNGLSVDFMVPVVDEKGQSVFLPISFFNEFGYAIEFNEKGQFEHYQIDFHAMAKHLKALDEQSQSQGFNISRVIFDPRLQPLLFNSEEGNHIQEHLTFNDKQAWVRHDEHYHVDFDLPCEKSSNGK